MSIYCHDLYFCIFDVLLLLFIHFSKKKQLFFVLLEDQELPEEVCEIKKINKKRVADLPPWRSRSCRWE